MIKLRIIDDYKNLYGDLSGKELTDALIGDVFRCEGISVPEIMRNENGKPVDKRGNVFFSVSHESGIFACAIAPSEIGLDIQKRLPGNMKRIAKRFFVAEDVANHEAISKREFIRIWTRNEALVKYLGCQLMDVMGKETVVGRDDVKFIDLDLGDGLYGSICISIEEEDDEIFISYGK